MLRGLPSVGEAIVIECDGVIALGLGREHSNLQLIGERFRVGEIQRHAHVRAAFPTEAFPRWCLAVTLV